MTQDEIIDMARKSDFEIHSDNLITWDGIDCTSELIAFAKLVRNHYSYTHAHLWLTRIEGAVKAEREACAKIVEESSLPDTYSEECLPDIAKEIRARGQE